LKRGGNEECFINLIEKPSDRQPAFIATSKPTNKERISFYILILS
jgi:hypothetical protein